MKGIVPNSEKSQSFKTNKAWEKPMMTKIEINNGSRASHTEPGKNSGPIVLVS